MSVKENFSFRFVFLLVIFVLGMFAGFYAHVSTPKIIKEKSMNRPKKLGFEYQGVMLPALTLSESYGGNFVIPMIHKDGYRSSELKAEKILWTRDGPVELTNPVMYEFDVDGKTVLTRMSGNFGKILIDLNTKQLKDVIIWGNAKIVRLTKEEVKEEVKEEKNE